MKLSKVCQIGLALCVTTGLLFHGTMAVAGKAQSKPSKPKNAAMVNGIPIDFGEFERRAQQMQMQPSGKSPSEIRSETLDQMIDIELIYQQSVKEGIKVDVKQVQDEMDGFKKNFENQKQFDKWLTSVNLTQQRLKEKLIQQRAVREFMEKKIKPQVKVTDAQVQSFYNENPQYFGSPEQIKVAHILIKVEKDADAKKKAAVRKQLADIKKKIDAGENFEELAKANSQCPSASSGGDLGYFSRGKMDPSFEKAAFELKPDQVSDIVETQFGYHLIKMIDYQPADNMPFDEVKDQILITLEKKGMEEKTRKYAADLRKTAKIEKYVTDSDGGKK